MTERDPKLLLFHAPLLRQDMTTPKAMRDVIYALLPATGAAVWYFGLGAVLLLVASIAGAVAAEWLFAPVGARHAPQGHVAGDTRGKSLLDGSGFLTGLFLSALGRNSGTKVLFQAEKCTTVPYCWLQNH